VAENQNFFTKKKTEKKKAFQKVAGQKIQKETE
jgi:hypothetical protein